MTGVALGNKVRKLESPADAVRKGAKTVLLPRAVKPRYADRSLLHASGLKPVLLLKKRVFQTAATFSSAGSWAPTSDLSIQTPLRDKRHDGRSAERQASRTTR